MAFRLDPSVLKTSRGFSYSYIRVAPNDSASKPTILFLHGFPSIALEWHNQIDFFSNLGYGIIAPDLLGYGRTSRPTDVADYRFKDICQDVIEILDHEGIDKVYGVAHDMGVGILSRLDFYFPHRLSRIALLATGYHPPGSVLDLNIVNESTKKQFGYSLLGYMQFFVEDAEAAKILNEHPESFFTLMYCEDPALWKEHLSPIGALKQWLLSNRQAAVGSWISQEYRMARTAAFAVNGGYTAPLNWYRSLVSNMNVADESEIGWKDFQSTKPLLLITAAKDTIVLPDVQIDTTKQWAGDLTLQQVSSGHWPMAEEADNVSSRLKSFFEDMNISGEKI